MQSRVNPSLIERIKTAIVQAVLWVSSKIARLWVPREVPANLAEVRVDVIRMGFISDSEGELEGSFRPRSAYLNAVTFLNQTPINELAAEKRIVLDRYVFDVDELVDHVKHDLCKLYKNPHLVTLPGYNFSAHAIQIIKAHKDLKDFAERLDAQLLTQKNNILPVTIDAVILLLTDMANSLAADSDVEIDENKHKILQSTTVFYEHIKTLAQEKRQQLNQFVIDIPVTTGGSQCMCFQNVMSLDCVLKIEIYLWQFVFMIKPEAFAQVSARVKDRAVRQNYSLGSDVIENNPENPPINIAHSSRPILALSNFPSGVNHGHLFSTYSSTFALLGMLDSSNAGASYASLVSFGLPANLGSLTPADVGAYFIAELLRQRAALREEVAQFVNEMNVVVPPPLAAGNAENENEYSLSDRNSRSMRS